MIFVPFLDRMTNQYETIRQSVQEVSLRGCEKITYPAPDLFDVKLPVNLLAFNLCKTQRDVYLFATGKRIPESWERYRGRVIHTFYHEIWGRILEIVSTSDLRSLDLDKSLTLMEKEIIEASLSKNQSVLSQLEGKYNKTDLETLQERLELGMKKIFCYERILSSALLNFELSSLFNQSSGNPLYQKALALSIGENFNASVLGFTNPVSPDFRYRNDVVGDIKTGPWQDYYYHTITAYALAIEAQTRSGVNCGIILHVDIRDSRPFPVHENVRFEVIDDIKRRRFLTIRDEKLRIAKEKVDPGRPSSSERCEGCGYYPLCWGDINGVA